MFSFFIATFVLQKILFLVSFCSIKILEPYYKKKIYGFIIHITDRVLHHHGHALPAARNGESAREVAAATLRGVAVAAMRRHAALCGALSLADDARLPRTGTRCGGVV